MAHIGSKGYYVKKLKEHQIRMIEGKRLESLKSHILANYYFDHVVKKRT